MVTTLLEIAHGALKHVNDSAATAMDKSNDQGEEQVGSQEASATEELSDIPVVKKADK
jgi:hypothetical protein